MGDPTQTHGSLEPPFGKVSKGKHTPKGVFPLLTRPKTLDSHEVDATLFGAPQMGFRDLGSGVRFMEFSSIRLFGPRSPETLGLVFFLRHEPQSLYMFLGI